MANELEALGQNRHQLLVNEARYGGAWKGTVESHNAIERATLAFFDEFVSILRCRSNQLSVVFKSIPIFLCRRTGRWLDYRHIRWEKADVEERTR
jgi:hypothetical protein